MSFLWIETTSSTMHPTESNPLPEESTQPSGELNSDKGPVERIKDDNLYCIESAFVFFRVPFSPTFI